MSGERLQRRERAGECFLRFPFSAGEQEDFPTPDEPGLFARGLSSNSLQARQGRVVVPSSQLKIDGIELKGDKRSKLSQTFVKAAQGFNGVAHVAARGVG